MRLSIGIVGLPNAGKSTLFNTLAGTAVVAAPYPFATIEPNIGMALVPDPRVETLADIAGSTKVSPASVRFVDIAGLVEGASRGEGLGNRFLAHIREATAICHVVRAFDDEGVAHVAETVEPVRDMAIVDTELMLADLESVERRLTQVEPASTSDPSLRSEVALLRSLRETLGAGRRPDPGADAETGLTLLTTKPVTYVFNCHEALLDDPVGRAELEEAVGPAESVFIDARLEEELAELDEADAAAFMDSLGLPGSGLERLIAAAFRALRLQTFLTANPNEARAWPIPIGTTAVEAAAEVHTDIARGFIAAEVIDYSTLVEAGSWQEARARGKVRTEGRDYVMKPYDVVEFRFNL